MSAIDEARFAHAVRFEEGKMATLSALARYDLDKGLVELTGTEPGVAAVPHVVNEQIAVDATRIDVTLDGPKVKARRQREERAAAAREEAAAKDDVRMPSMLKQDQPVNVTRRRSGLRRRGVRSRLHGQARSSGRATRRSRPTRIAIDDKTRRPRRHGRGGDERRCSSRPDKDKKKERVRSIATAKDFKYEDAIRRATYTGDAHLSGPQGDMTAAKIELYLKPSGDELERAEAYDERDAARAEPEDDRQRA